MNTQSSQASAVTGATILRHRGRPILVAEDGSMAEATIQERGTGYVRNPKGWDEELRKKTSKFLQRDLSQELDAGGGTRRVQNALGWLARLVGHDTLNAADNRKFLATIDGFIFHERKNRPCDYRQGERLWCPMIRDQGSAETCSSHVVANLFEFLERKNLVTSAEPEQFDEKTLGTAMNGASRLFLHQVATMLATRGQAFDPATRKLKTKDGLAISEVLKVLVRYGVPPEAFWSYPEPTAGGAADAETAEAALKSALEAEPTAFTFKIAEAFKAKRLIRLDHPEDLPALLPKDMPERDARAKELQLILMRSTLLFYGLPLTAGILNFPTEIARESQNGEIPYPDEDDAGQAIDRVGGHAVLIVGFDEAKKIVHPVTDEPSAGGAFLFQNSWGPDWGQGGYGWLPYEYVLRGQVDDVWTVSRATFTNLGEVETTSFVAGERSDLADMTAKDLKAFESYLRGRLPPGFVAPERGAGGAGDAGAVSTHRSLTRAIAVLGSSPRAFGRELRKLPETEQEILTSGDSDRILDAYAFRDADPSSDAYKLATLVALLATSWLERIRYSFVANRVLRETGLSAAACTAFIQGQAEAIEKVLRGLRGPGEGGPLRRDDPPPQN